ncbi:MAG: SprT family zinc-dependent metalloprotease [Spirochaetota bacterium]
MSEAFTDTIQWGSSRVTYAWSYADRKTLAISVHPDLSVTVKAPLGTELEVIREKVRKRARWIRQAQNDFELYLPKQPARQHVNGEAHRYLGRQYRLKAIQGEQESVKCLRGYLRVSCLEEPSPEHVARLLDDWYRDKARKVFAESLENCRKRFDRFDIGTPGFTIRKMGTRWGSCSRAGRITLNLELIKAPKDCIDYVITHELCHLMEPHHGPRFWRLMEMVMPDWEERRKRLNLYADL